jgi:hypothetical protein
MTVEKFGFLIIGVIIIGIFSGCIGGAKCPECPPPSTYSECNDQAVKTRTNYRCSEATDFQCESYTQEMQCETEITLTGSIDATVTPSIEETVKGVIKIEAKNVPPDAKIVAYFIDGGDLPPVGAERGPLFATKKGDVWTGMLDTEEYENGLYKMFVGGFIEETMEGDPDYYARGQILISN